MKFKLARSVGVPADVAAGELERIRQQNEALTASAVVEAARPEDSPLHPAFEWDDSAAAEQYRLHQARALIRSVQVIVESREPQTFYVHVPNVKGGEGDYGPISVVVHESDRLERATRELMGKVAAAKEAADELLEAASHAKQSKAVKQQVRRIKQVSEHLDAAQVAMQA